MTRNVLFATAALGGLMCVNLSASPISGTFNIAGSITVTNTLISWQLDTAPFTANKANLASGTGAFAGLGGTTVTIQTLDRTIEPVGTPIIPPPLFLSFDAAPGLPALDISFIFPGLYSPAQCTTQPPAVGQVCTVANSPFSFQNNNPPPPDGPQATATFAFAGITSDQQNRWQGNFTSQFFVPYQTVLQQLLSTGSVTNTFSATFIVTPNAGVPESGTLAMLGLGLVAISAKLRHRRRG